MRNVARTVWEDVDRSHAHQNLAAGHPGKQRIVEAEFGAAVYPQSTRLLSKADEQEADLGIDAQIAQALEHSIAVVIRKNQKVGRGNAHKSRRAAYERAIRPAFGIGRRDEEERHAFDEILVRIGEAIAAKLLVKPVCQGTALETVLKLPVALVIHLAAPRSGNLSPFRPTGRRTNRVSSRHGSPRAGTHRASRPRTQRHARKHSAGGEAAGRA